jgi:hypothetical protein
MSNILENYNSLRNIPSDINEHLPILFEYGKNVKTIAEFGVRNAVSCYAFAASRPEKMICVDIVKTQRAEEFCGLCKNENINLRFDVADTTQYSLEQVDLLFIDTLHTYAQLKRELELHNFKVNRYIILHDTITYGFIEDIAIPRSVADGQWKQGLMPAVMEFLQDHREWCHFKTYPNNNGLTVLERR